MGRKYVGREKLRQRVENYEIKTDGEGERTLSHPSADSERPGKRLCRAVNREGHIKMVGLRDRHIGKTPEDLPERPCMTEVCWHNNARPRGASGFIFKNMLTTWNT